MAVRALLSVGVFGGSVGLLWYKTFLRVPRRMAVGVCVGLCRSVNISSPAQRYSVIVSRCETYVVYSEWQHDLSIHRIAFSAHAPTGSSWQCVPPCCT